MTNDPTHRIVVRDWHRPIRELVVDQMTGRLLSKRRGVSDRVTGFGRRHGFREPVLVYKVNDAGGAGLVAQQGPTKLRIDQQDCRSDLRWALGGLVQRLIVRSGNEEVAVTDVAIGRRLWRVVDVAYDDVDDAGEDFVRWLEDLLRNPRTQKHLLATWAAIGGDESDVAVQSGT